MIDELTGLLNRKGFVNRADEVVQQSEVTGDPVGLVVGDVDHFKRVNDEGGHANEMRSLPLASVQRKPSAQLSIAFAVCSSQEASTYAGGWVPFWSAW